MKRGKGVFIGLLFLSTVASTSIWAGDIAFSDISGHWGKPAIEEAVRKSYVDGFENGTFRPDQHVTRAEFIKMAVTALKMEVPAIAPGDNWYTPYNNAAVNAGIHQWRDFTDGDWNTPITRLEMARIALRASDAELQKPGVLLDEKSLMFKATSKGLIQGMDETGTLGLDEPTTRAQSVTIIERILKVKDGGTLPIDKHAVSRAEVLWHGTNVFTMLPRYFNATDIGKFDLSEFQWDSSDGIYHEEVVEFIAVDMEDPNDPFRSEIEGMPFTYAIIKDGGFVEKSWTAKAPEKSFVTYSKVKQVITGQYPLDLYVADGGKLMMSKILPKDAAYDERKEWATYYSNIENEDTIYFTKGPGAMPAKQWNIDKGYNPLYANVMPVEGGTYLWITATVHPKGEYYSSDQWFTRLSYTPNIGYMKTYGPHFSHIVTFNTNYELQNP